MLDKANLLVAAIVAVVMVVVGIAYVNVISDNDSAANDKPQKQTRAEAVALRKKTVALGNRLYADNCAECHGVNLEGQPNWRVKKADGTLPAPPHDATGHTWHHPDSLLFSITKNGGQAGAPAGFVSAMPAFGETLTDSDIWAVLTYIKSRWPAAARKRQKLMTDRAG